MFDTVPESPVPSTLREKAVGKYLRSAWAAFAKNPTSGLAELQCHGAWPNYKFDGETLNQISFDNQTGTNLARGDAYDGYCAQVGVPVA